MAESSYYSQFAGLNGLRRVLNAMTNDVPVYVLTHSRGANVILSALGNPNFSPKLRKGWDTNDTLWAHKLESQPLKRFKHFRVAMIAPALATFDFACFNKANEMVAEKIIVGFNECDPALSKRSFWEFLACRDTSIQLLLVVVTGLTFQSKQDFPRKLNG
jgi:hypothetical protein